MAVQGQLLAQGDALVSPCGRYRYSLLREWDSGRPRIAFIMLNPSTADAQQDDPTIRRCVAFAKCWGYGSLDVGNLYAYRSTDPAVLSAVDDPVGPENDDALLVIAEHAACTVAAWGAHVAAEDRARHVVELLQPAGLHCLGTTKHGHPRHPLYVPASQPLIPYERSSDDVCARCGRLLSEHDDCLEVG